MLFVPAGSAPPRLAALAHRSAIKDPSHPSGETRPGAGPSADLLGGSLDHYRPIQLRLIQDATSAVSSAPISTSITTSATALPTVHNYDTGCGRRSPNSLLWPLCYLPAPPGGPASWSAGGTPAQSSPGGQSQSIPDSPLGPHPPPRHHILALTARQLPCDWQTHYGITPVLLETLVDPAHYPGICYRAANWTPSA